MYARVTLLEIDVLRADMDDVLERYRRDLLPGIESQTGYEGIVVLATPEGQGLVMTLWRDEQALEASAAMAAGVTDEFTTFYRSAPGRESYEVRLADVPALAVD